MIKIQKTGTLLTLFLSIGILFSCNDNSSTEAFNVLGDVFVSKRMINNEAMFANSYYAYGNQAMTMAQVTDPEGTEITLHSTNSDSYTFGKPASSNDFSLDAPMEGNYTFDVINEEIQYQATDLLVFNNIDFTVIDSTSMQNEKLMVAWEENADAEVYMIRLISDEGEIVFNSPTLPNQTTAYEIDTYSGAGTWASGYPNNGDTYTLELHAFIFDEDATEIDFSYNIQEVSISEEVVNWN